MNLKEDSSREKLFLGLNSAKYFYEDSFRNYNRHLNLALHSTFTPESLLDILNSRKREDSELAFQAELFGLSFENFPEKLNYLEHLN